jgi:hypothetical protein
MSSCVSDAEVEFLADTMRIVRKYIQNKTLDTMQQRFEILKNELDCLVEDLAMADFIDIETPISIESLPMEDAVGVMGELGEKGFETIPPNGVYVRVKLVE